MYDEVSSGTQHPVWCRHLGSGSSLGSLDGGGAELARRRGRPQGSTHLAGFKAQVRAQWCDLVSPSVSFLDISPAKAGGDIGAEPRLVPSSRFWLLPHAVGMSRACEAEGSNHPYPRVLVVRLLRTATPTEIRRALSP